MSAGVDWLFANEPIRWFQRLVGPDHPLPFRGFSLLGDTWGIVFVVGLALWLFGRRAMYPLLGIVVLGAATQLALSGLFDVSRPDGAGIVVYDRPEVGSFPSGHVYQVVGPWGMLYAMGCLPLWIPALVTVLVAIGRLYLGAHYLADLLAGIAFGAALVWLYARFWPTLGGWFRERGRVIELALAVLVIGGTLVWMTVMDPRPRRFEIAGMALGAAIGLPLEHRLLRYEPVAGSPAAAVGRLVLGLAGIAALLLWDRSQSDAALLLGTLTAGMATLWALLGAPALFVAIGIGRSGRAGRRGPRTDEEPE